MSLKNITININSASETVQSLRIAGGEGGAGARGQGVRIKALANVKYHFTDEATGYGPENIATKRVGKNLHIAFEGGDVNQPDLVIEDYYKDNGEIGYGEGSDNLLVGTHENGNVYPYVPESAVSTDAVSMLADGVQAGQALGTSVAPVPLWWLPLLLIPALAAGGGDGGTPPVPGPTADPKVAETLDDEGLEGGIPGAPDDSDVPGELTTTSGKLPFTAPAGLKSIVLNYGGTHLGSEEVTSSWDPDTHTLTISSKDAARGDLMTILVDQGTGEYTITLLKPLMHAEEDVSTENDIVLELGYTVTDKQNRSVDSTLTVTVDDDVPQAHADTATQATEGAPIEIDALGNDEFGADGVDTDNAPKVVVTVLTQPAQGTVTYDAATGKFTYTPNAGAGSTSTTDSFTYQIEDGDGDKSSATVTITLQADSVPVVKTVNHATVDEDGLSNANVDASPLLDTETDSTESATDTKTLVVTYGNDVPADLLAAIKLSNAGLDTQLDALGGDVTWTLSTDGRTLTGSVGTTPVMTIAITGASVTDAATGEVTYTYEVKLLQPVTHPGNDNEDTVTLRDIGFTVTDKDGDPVSGKFNVSVVDDVPQAHADTASQTTEGVAFEIDALVNDEFGADGVDTDNAPTVVVTVTTQPTQGVVTYNATTGKFTYTPNAGAGSTSTTDSFTYTIVDGDGDESTATVNITLQGDSTPLVKTVNHATVDEDGFTNANVDASPLLGTETDSTESLTDEKTLVVTYGNDVPTDLLGAIKLSAAGLDDQLTALGAGVKWTVSADGLVLTGKSGTTDVMTISITGASVTAAATGEVTYTYKVELLQPVTHPVNDNEDTATLTGVGFTVTDLDTDPVSGAFNVSVVDDVPHLGPIQIGQADSDPAATPARGSLYFEAGADGTGTVDPVDITFNTTTLRYNNYAIVTEQVGNVLTGYADLDNDGVYDQGESAVFTLEVDPTTDTYTFDLLAKIDGSWTPASIGGSQSYGSGPANFQALTETASGDILALLSGWTVGTTFNEADWLASTGYYSTGLTFASVNGSTTGWGVDDNNFNTGDFMRFDFGQPVDDFDATGPYAPSGATLADGDLRDVSYATFSSKKALSTADQYKILVHYEDGSTSYESIDGSDFAYNAQTQLYEYTVTAPNGKTLDWIDIYATAGSVKMGLSGVGVQSETIDTTLDFTVKIPDGDGDYASSSLAIRVADDLTPSVPILI